MDVLMFFLPESPMIWLFIIAIVFLLFGGSKLPQLAKALGQSKRAFKEGLSEAEQEENQRKEVSGSEKSLSAVDDETLFEEARRRARLHVGEGSATQEKK
jgi:sec-independent protein translocase protein TatA